jgi:hypothetical protein
VEFSFTGLNISVLVYPFRPAIGDIPKIFEMILLREWIAPKNICVPAFHDDSGRRFCHEFGSLRWHPRLAQTPLRGNHRKTAHSWASISTESLTIQEAMTSALLVSPAGSRAGAFEPVHG